MSLPVLLWRCLVSCVWLAPAVFPPVSCSLIILVYFSPSFHSVRCRDLLHFPAVCSACLISSGVVPVYLVLYFTAVSSKIKACLWVCSGILSCLLHTAIHDPDINKYTDSPSAPFHWSELARCFQKEIQTYVNRLLTTSFTECPRSELLICITPGIKLVTIDMNWLHLCPTDMTKHFSSDTKFVSYALCCFSFCFK